MREFRTSGSVGAPAAQALGRPDRYRSVQEKIQIVEEAEQPGASVAEVARRHGVNANLLFGWRRLYRQGALRRDSAKPAKLLPVRVVAAEPARTALPAAGAIEIELPGGVRLRVTGDVSAEQLSAVLAAVARRR
jgi:transposase